MRQIGIPCHKFLEMGIAFVILIGTAKFPSISIVHLHIHQGYLRTSVSLYLLLNYLIFAARLVHIHYYESECLFIEPFKSLDFDAVCKQLVLASDMEKCCLGEIIV